MSAVKERTGLCVVELPKILTSRRNLLAHFSKFGEVKSVSVNKEIRTGLIIFSTNFDAQAAKTQGATYEGKTLKVFWSESTLDPRARGNEEYIVPDTDQLWQDDDKECFGVESSQSNLRDERKQSANEMIKQHLKLSETKKRLGIKLPDDTSKSETISQSPPKLKLTKSGESVLLKSSKSGKNVPKSPISLKNISLTQDRKRKVIRKQKVGLENSSNRLSSVLPKQVPNLPTVSVFEKNDLKHKLDLLDERDKLIRKGTVQNSNIKTAVAIKGTCPDMCPERERILRQCGHAVAYYEMVPGTNEMDENKAVKEYIRSSADQGVQLSHDLRPEPVLTMTMSYLIRNIINRVDNPDENKSVWYSFCWNRLRSIRKDIIFQQLCDLETVVIIEQCARFHISCYDHMWGAEVSSGFEDKNNTHNLLDCLQILRHMYEDLSKQNVTCPNEAEFYSYLILLKLESGDVMWEYQQYSLEIQFSSHVQFAIEAYMAFKNNMYSRYFNLVKKGSYLTACLMQRYFDKVRAQALKTMLKAYSLPGRSVGLSPSFIVSSLKFDSQKNAMRFCEKEGVVLKMDCNEDDHDVYVTTSSFLIRDKRLPIANAVVGESNALPIYIPHDVHSSFDEFGNLKQTITSVLTEDETNDVSEESAYSEGEKTEINIPEVNVPQQTGFKFSLSPTKIQDNIFGSPLSQTNTIRNDGSLNNNEQIHFSFDSKGSSLDTSNSIENYNDHTDCSFDMEQDFEDNASKSDENKMDEEPVSGVQELWLKSHTVAPINIQCGSQQPFTFSLSSPPNKKSTLSFVNEETGAQIMTNNNNFSLKNHYKNGASAENRSKEISLAHSFINKQYTDSFNEKFSSNGIVLTNSKLEQKSKFEVLQEESLEYNKQVESKETYSRMNELISKKEFKHPYIKMDKPQNLNFDKHNTSLELENLLRKKAEEEKLKLDEMKRIEIENRNRRIEEKKTLQKLKKDLSERLKAINARKYARQWRERINQLKQTRADFPMLVHLSVNKHLSVWGTIDSVPINSIFKRAVEKKNLSNITSRLLLSGITDSYKYIAPDIAESLAKTATKTMKKGIIKPIYWKLAISVPSATRSTSELSVFNQLIRRWCKQSFYCDENSSLGSVECVMTSLQIPVNISTHFLDDIQSTHDLQGMDALIFVVLNESETEKMCLQRLHTLITLKAKSSEFSVAVMNIGGCKFERVLKIELEELHEQNLIAQWMVNSWSNPDSIIDSLNFLTKQINVVPHICATTLELLVKQVSEEFFDALSSGQHSSNGLMEAIKNPNNVISLYNTCMTKLEDLLMSSKLEKYFNFGEEFKMHIPLNESGGPELMCGKQYTEKYKAQISRKLSSLKLSEFSKWPVTSINRLTKTLKALCIEVHDVSIFPQIIRMLDIRDDSSIEKHLEQFNWLNVVEILAQCNIKHTFSTKDKSKRLFVIYNKNDVQRMIKKQWWLRLPMVVQLHNVQG